MIRNPIMSKLKEGFIDLKENTLCVTTEALDRIAGKRAKSTTAPTTLKIIPSYNFNFIS